MNRAHALALLALVVGCSASSAPPDAGGDAAVTSALCVARGLCVLGGPAGPSGFTGPDSCWNGCNWCHCSAAGALSECTALACDAGPPVRDAGIDCSTIGCGATPMCGQACDAPCGCCPCADGSEMGSDVCTGGCWAPRGTGASGDACSATSDCGTGLSCCYPCGIPGCTNQCTPTCTPGDPGCVGGCLQRA